VLFEETQKTLLCSDLFHQTGDVEPLTSADVVGRSHKAMKEYQAGILADYVPCTPLTAQNLRKLADLKPKTLAIMHGSSFTGDCARAIDDLNVAFREVFGQQKIGCVSGFPSTLWKDADPDIPILIAAKAEYAKLR
jgi:flavorubredoxin